MNCKSIRISHWFSSAFLPPVRFCEYWRYLWIFEWLALKVFKNLALIWAESCLECWAESPDRGCSDSWFWACYCFDSWFRAQTWESLQHHRCYNDEWPACRWPWRTQAGTGYHEGGIILSKKPPEWHLSPPLPVVIFNSRCPRRFPWSLSILAVPASG